MIDIDCDAELSVRAQAMLGGFVRELMPRLDPDGRGRVAVRVTTPGPERSRVEIICRGASPPLAVAVVDADPIRAIQRAFEVVARALGAR